jgi:phage repressor protein C with HTH and peptisase S24 domain
VLAKPRGGSGGLETDDSVDGYYAFRSEWLRAKGQPASMRLMTVTGESMAPRIEDGDMVLVDESQTDLYEGRIYVVRIDREIVIKRIAKVPGKVLLVSDNPAAEPRRIELDLSDESVDWAPVGRVLYVAKDLR